VDRRAKLSLVLVLVALTAGGLVMAGAGAERDEPAARGAPAAPSPKFLSDLATPREYELWNDRGCVTCHGTEGLGTPLGPNLAKVMPLYLAKSGSREAAVAALAAYVLDPQGAPKLRDDGEVYPNPMPALEKLFGGRREEAPVLADMLLRLAK
jgi:mono/diheme cytochrome c family protein